MSLSLQVIPDALYLSVRGADLPISRPSGMSTLPNPSSPFPIAALESSCRLLTYPLSRSSATHTKLQSPPLSSSGLEERRERSALASRGRSCEGGTPVVRGAFTSLHSFVSLPHRLRSFSLIRVFTLCSLRRPCFSSSSSSSVFPFPSFTSPVSFSFS